MAYQRSASLVVKHQRALVQSEQVDERLQVALGGFARLVEQPVDRVIMHEHAGDGHRDQEMQHAQAEHLVFLAHGWVEFHSLRVLRLDALMQMIGHVSLGNRCHGLVKRGA